MDFRDFFARLAGQQPYPYQVRLGESERFPEVLEVPTGLGKTAAAILAWLFHRLERPAQTPRRLIYCLPMRVLVEQVMDNVAGWLAKAAPLFQEADRPLPTVWMVMGGEAPAGWMDEPGGPAILVGTQDMLLSRALNRGYGMSRYRWPQAFGLVNSDCQWVVDETQLMGPGLPTTAQLQGLRAILGTLGPARTMWMSATLAASSLDTVDHQPGAPGRSRLALEAGDREAAKARLRSRKVLHRCPVALDRENARKSYPTDLAAHVLASHQSGSRTLVMLNSVGRAQAVFQALLKKGADPERLVLLHSRFRRPDRRAQETRLGDPDQIVVSTQVIEAGVDLSSRLLISELAPWSSLVQRFGRCNRAGEFGEARVEWVDVELGEGKPDLALPYESGDLAEAREHLLRLGEVGPMALEGVGPKPREVVHPVLRRRDLLDLFDTSPDLSGDDLDISPYLRDSEGADVQVYWRPGRPVQDEPGPARDELVSLPIGAAQEFLKKQRAWQWNPLTERWEDARRLRAGLVLRLSCEAGGYLADRGWIGEGSAAPVQDLQPVAPVAEAMGGDPEAQVGRWIPLTEHAAHVVEETRALAGALALPADLVGALVTAARWHDVGKAHPAFQSALQGGEAGTIWAKSATGTGRLDYRVDGRPRPGFRHELASALAWLQREGDGPGADLVAWLIACHHGKVRLSLRALPGENPPPEPDRLFARGIWDGDELPDLPDLLPGPLALDLSRMRLGRGSWTERMLALRDDPERGPFLMGALESVVRAADGRASAKERQ